MSFLTQAVNPLETFNYNPVGNRTNSNQNGASVFNTANQLLEDANFTYQYDNNGNMTRKTAKIGGAITQFEYDAENKLVRVVSPSNTANYKYDGLDRRVEKEVIAGSTTVTKYVYDNEDILLELDGSNNIVARYTHGPAIDEPLIMEKNSQPFYYHADGLGSVTELTNQSGTVAQRYTYSSFGKIESQLDANFVQPFTFTSREFDAETGLYYYRTRYYEPNAGHFISEDPIRFAGGDINLYRYVLANPVNLRDPSGRDWVSATKNLVTGVIAGAATTVAVSAGIASGTIVSAAVAIGAVGVGAYQGTIALQELILGIDPYTGRPLTTEERVDVAAGLAGAALGGGLAGRGAEIIVGQCRIAPLGNRTGNPTGEMPHYHRGVPNPTSPGQSLPGQGIGRHRPWDTKSTDTSFWDRF